MKPASRQKSIGKRNDFRMKRSFLFGNSIEKETVGILVPLGFLALQATKGEMDDGAYLFPYKFGGSDAIMLLELACEMLWIVESKAFGSL